MMHRRFNREIDHLKQRILQLGALVENAFMSALESVRDHSGELARSVIEKDRVIDLAEVDLEEDCLKLLALYQPVARDLRFVVAVLKINNDLERIGDLAVNIAERAVFLSESPRIGFPFDFSGMSSKTSQMLRQSLDALSTGDIELAREVCRMDDEVDRINRLMYEQVHEAIRKNPERADSLIQILGISRSIERIADHATDIAEDVVYMTTGEIIRHHYTLHPRMDEE